MQLCAHLGDFITQVGYPLLQRALLVGLIDGVRARLHSGILIVAGAGIIGVCGIGIGIRSCVVAVPIAGEQEAPAMVVIKEKAVAIAEAVVAIKIAIEAESKTKSGAESRTCEAP